MAKDLEAPKPFVPSGFADGDKLDAGGVEEMRFGLAGSGPLAKAVLDSNAVGTMRQLVGGGATPTTTIPVGTISPYAGTLAPANWLLCDGSAVSRTTYSALFAVISTTYGVGDGSTTFNLPTFVGTYTKFIIKSIPDVSNTFGIALTGTAGGMLSGTYPNPSVASISGLAAGGGLTGTYPNPTVASIAGLAAGGSLSGTYPNPALAANEAWRVVGAAGQPAFSGSWSNYGSGYTPARFKKDKENTVFIEGLVQGGSGTIFTLPSGYAPTGGSLIFSTVTNPNTIGRLELATSGTVSMNVGSTTWFSICCSFKAE